jgi:hypothetical protein
MKIIGCDVQGSFVKDIQKKGARYLSKITYDRARQTLTFWGQEDHTVSATLDELAVQPTVAYLPSSSGPLLPYTLAYGNPDPNKYPVIQCGDYSFWPTTYKDGRNSLSVVVTNKDNVIQKIIDCPGTSLIQDIEINDVDRTILLNGWDGSKASFDYETAMACFYYGYTVTKDDFLSLAKYFHVPLSSSDATILEEAMPVISGGLCNPRIGYTWTKWWRYGDPIIVGPFLGGYIGTLGAFLIGGSQAVDSAWIVSTEATMNMGPTVDSAGNIGDYSPSKLEREHSLVE